MKPICIMARLVLLNCLLLACLLAAGCTSTRQDPYMIYPRKPADTDDRKAGAAMLFYEQAEKDLDVNDSVIVIPPEDQSKAPVQP